MNATIENATYTLTGVIDLRVWNECDECYEPVDMDERIACARLWTTLPEGL